MKVNEKIFRLLERNKVEHQNKPAIIDGDYSINWSEFHDITLIISEFLDDIYPESYDDKLKGFVVNGDGCALHVLFIISLILNFKIYIPFSRTIQRDKSDKIDNFNILTIKDNKVYYENDTFLLNDFQEQKMTAQIKKTNPESPAVFYYTSGTTGTPKTIVSSDTNLIKGGNYIIEALNLRGEDVIAGTLTLDFDYGVNQIICNLILGSTYIVCPFSSNRYSWLNEILRNGATIIPTMPFLIESYFPKNKIIETNLVRIVTSSGAPFTRLHAAKVQKLFPKATMVPMYGLSEGFRSTILPPGEYVQKPDSVGIPIGDTTIAIVDENYKPLPPYAVGQIIQSSGCTTWGYMGEVEKNSEKFFNDLKFPNRLWTKTGDLGYLDADGYLFVKGRVDNQIKVFGIRVSVDEIEIAFKELHGIDNVVILPINKNETESNFVAGVVSKLSVNEINKKIRSLPKEFQPIIWKKIPKVIENDNGGKPDRTKNRIIYFND